MNKEEIFSRLVENAFDFLFKVISEIEGQPKYSVVHFYAAVELFVKARLMTEHRVIGVSSGLARLHILAGETPARGNR